jgi:aspartate kinase
VAAPTPPACLAAALKADECQIYTDVDGVYTTDPRIVPEARKLDTITFEEMLEMASLGSKVLQIRSVEFAGKYKVKLRVLSSFRKKAKEEGTLITVEEDKNMEQPIISGIAFNRDEAKLTVLGVPDRPGIAYQILGPVADANIDVDMIIQNVGHDGTTDFSFTVNRSDYDKAMKILEDVKTHIGAREIARRQQDLQGLHRRRRHALPPGRRQPMFRTLAEEGINIQMISTSEIKISVVVDEKYLELAVRVLHRAPLIQSSRFDRLNANGLNQCFPRKSPPPALPPAPRRVPGSARARPRQWSSAPVSARVSAPGCRRS